MVIKLGNDWYIEDDGSGFMLYKWTGRVSAQKRGSETKVYDYMKYPSTLESAIALYVRLKVVDENEIIELKDYVNQMNEAYKNVENMLKIRVQNG